MKTIKTQMKALTALAVLLLAAFTACCKYDDSAVRTRADGTVIAPGDTVKIKFRVNPSNAWMPTGDMTGADAKWQLDAGTAEKPVFVSSSSFGLGVQAPGIINTGTTGNFAFSDCSALTEVTLPASVTSIGRYAFSNCDALKKVAIIDGMKTIESGVFKGCATLAEIAIPDGVTTIGGEAFSSCASLTDITIPPARKKTLSSRLRIHPNVKNCHRLRDERTL